MNILDSKEVIWIGLLDRNLEEPPPETGYKRQAFFKGCGNIRFPKAEEDYPELIAMQCYAYPEGEGQVGPILPMTYRICIRKKEAVAFMGKWLEIF